jgi:hypothetical protein
MELHCRHIPDRYEHLVRNVGWYSNRVRGARAKKAFPQAGVIRLRRKNSPPLGPANWYRHADLPLTYHPVPDIA